MKVACSMLVLVLLLCSFTSSLVTNTKLKIWKYSSDALDVKNRDLSTTNCQGLEFAEENSAQIVLRSITISQMVLPFDGIITFQNNTVINLDNNHQGCLKLKPFMKHSFSDYHSWRLNEDNPAVPDLHRVPCQGDNASFPDELSYTDVESNQIEADEGDLVLSALKFGKKNIVELPESTDGTRFLDKLKLANNECQDCVCHIRDVPCPPVIRPIRNQCLDPVLPHDFCTPICGAYITFFLKSDSNLNEMKETLNVYESYTYTSVLSNDLERKYQIVFAEKDFSGVSLADAKHFFEQLGKFSTHGMELYSSGQYYASEAGNHFAAWIFVPMMAVAGFFALVFYASGDTSRINRFIQTFGSSARTGFRDGFLARFDPTQENLIIEQQSLAGSAPNLDKSFDNPMYGTSTTDAGENPLYRVLLGEEKEE